MLSTQVSSGAEEENVKIGGKTLSPLPYFSSSREVIRSWFKTIPSNWLYRPHLDGRKQDYTFTLALSPSILRLTGNQGVYLTKTLVYLLCTIIFKLKQSLEEHFLLVTTHTHIAFNSILESLPQIDTLGMYGVTISAAHTPPCCCLLGHTMPSPVDIQPTTYINECSPTCIMTPHEHLTVQTLSSQREASG